MIMTSSWNTEYKVVIKVSQSVASAQFRQLMVSIKMLLKDTKKRIPKSDKRLLEYSDFIETKVFKGIEKSDRFQFSSQSKLKNLIAENNNNQSESAKKLYEKAIRLSLLESKNIASEQDDLTVADTLESINSIDGILSSRLGRINKSRIVSKKEFITFPVIHQGNEQLRAINSVKRSNSSKINKINKISFENQKHHEIQEHAYVKSEKY